MVTQPDSPRYTLGKRRAGLLSIAASVFMILWGVVLVLCLPRAAAGVTCICVGGLALVVWSVLWPRAKRTGRV